jgi:hypothetical protein
LLRFRLTLRTAFRNGRSRTPISPNISAPETKRIADNCLAEIRTAEDWKQRAPEYRQQLAEMLSLSPMPERTELKATVTRRFEHDTFTVENLHFQSRPGLYATANLYVPKNLTKPAPTILYVCGHGPVITNGVSYGNKVAYQHHGVWFARNGYVLPHHRHAAARRDSRAAPRHASRRDVVVEFAGLTRRRASRRGTTCARSIT